MRADKGGNRQLNNTNYYLIIQQNNMKRSSMKQSGHSLKKNCYPNNSAKTFCKTTAKHPTCISCQKYISPTIQEDIVSSIGSPMAKISHFVDIHLENIVNEIKSHIKDTTDFINKIKTITGLPENTILVTMDVKSLFTNIPNTEGINAVAILKIKRI